MATCCYDDHDVEKRGFDGIEVPALDVLCVLREEILEQINLTRVELLAPRQKIGERLGVGVEPRKRCGENAALRLSETQ